MKLITPAQKGSVMKSSLLSNMHLSDSRIVTLVGAGGKTSLMYALSHEMSASHKTLLTTTTHIMEPRNLFGAFLITEESREKVISAFQTSNLVALGIPLSHTHADNIKWGSPSLSFLENVQDTADCIFCEGDGSRRLPVKIPREREPVFYPGTDTVIGVIGLSCLGQPARSCLFGWNPDVDFPALQAALARGQGFITPEVLSVIALSPKGLKKGVATRQYHVIFNQADCLSGEDLQEMCKTAQKIRDNGAYCHIVSLKQGIFYDSSPILLR